MFEGVVAELMELSDDALTERFRTLELQRRRIEAEMAAIVREGERRSIHHLDGHRTIRHWTRAQINCSSADATRLRRLAVTCDTVIGLGDALLEGHIGVAQAHELSRLATHPRVGDEFANVAPLLVDHAEQLSFEDFRVVARRWETLADLDGAERYDERSHDRRAASVQATADGVDIVASGGTAMTAAELQGIFARFVEAEFDVDVAARTATFGPDAPASQLPRSDAQRRFDALAAIFRAAASAPADGVAPRPVVNLLVGLDTYERLARRRASGVDAGIDVDVDLHLERIETDTDVTVSPADVLAATVIGHVRRVVVDSAGVVVDAGRKRRLFTGPAREMALLLAGACDHLGCTVPAAQCDVDHVAEWIRDHGGTNQINGRPRCTPHNGHKSANGIRVARTRHGTTVDLRADGTPVAPVGRRIELADTGPPEHVDLPGTIDPPDSSAAPGGVEVADRAGYRTVRVEYCRVGHPSTRAEIAAAVDRST